MPSVPCRSSVGRPTMFHLDGLYRKGLERSTKSGDDSLASGFVSFG
jgi:hypothetical protein